MSGLDPVPFFTAITHSSHGTYTDWLIDITEDYFHLGHLSGKKVTVLSNDKVAYKRAEEPPAYLLTALKIVSYATIVLPLVMLISKMTLRSLNSFHIVKDGLSIARIEQCWKNHVQPFTIKHGTSSIYVNHFKKHGISATYPERLHTLVTNIRKVWANHEHDVIPKTDYFHWFEQRYDNARDKKKIKTSFTADTFRTEEYTTGERGYGGEWMREVRNFLWEKETKKVKFTDEEEQIIADMCAFNELLRNLPPMTVAIRGGSQALVKAIGTTPLLPLPDFKSMIAQSFQEWQDDAKLGNYLDDILIPKIQSVTKFYESQYEVTVFRQIDPEELEFEILHEGRKKEPMSADFPLLAFDIPTKLSLHECLKLQIHQKTYTSDIPDYSDSQFNVSYNAGDNHTMTITRIKRTEETKALIAEQDKKRKLHHDWLEALECQELAQYMNN